MNRTRDKKVLLFAKSIDGGTGTFILSFLDRYQKEKPKFSLRTVVLETPRFRNTTNYDIAFLRRKKFYPEHYRISIYNIVNFIQELRFLSSKARNIDIIIGVDSHCN